TGGAGLSGTLTSEWQYSVDGGITWINIPSTLTTTTNGNIDTYYSFPAYAYTPGTLFRVQANNNGCLSYSLTATFMINPTPTVNQPPNQILCAGTLTNAVVFSGDSVTSFSWTNNNPQIGLGANGTGNISPFVTINNGVTNDTATITVTPVYTNST